MARHTHKIKALVAGIMLCLAGPMCAEELEYRYEVGGMTGGSFYYGDANYSGFLNNMNLMGGAVWRYNLNLRMAIKANLAIAGISGATADGDNKFPGGDTDFSRTLYR